MVGQYSVSVTVRASAAGTATDAPIGSESIRVIPNPVDAASSIIMTPSANMTSTAGGVIPIRIQPRDRFGNPAVAEEELEAGIDTFVAEVAYDSVGPRSAAADGSHTASAVFDLAGEAALSSAPSWASLAWGPLSAGVARVSVWHVKTFPNDYIERTEVGTTIVTVRLYLKLEQARRAMHVTATYKLPHVKHTLDLVSPWKSLHLR